MRYLKIFRNVFLFLLFWVILGYSILGIRQITWQKEDLEQYYFAQQAPDSVDLVFIGSSHQYCSIDPNLINDRFGINSVMLAHSGQTMAMSYFAVREALELQHPKAIALELYYLGIDQIFQYTCMHPFLDDMPACAAKDELIETLGDRSEHFYYYHPFGTQHHNWERLSEKNFLPNPALEEGKVYSWHDERVCPCDAIVVVDSQELGEVPFGPLKYFRMIVELCQENDVGLICYVVPFHDDHNNDYFEQQRIYNTLYRVTAEYEIPYWNLFHHLDELQLDDKTDYQDGTHLNASGQQKLTNYMIDAGYFDLVLS